MNNQKPILVTGSHRSGTTWVGKMISASPRVGYIHEPFHPKHRPGIYTAAIPYWFLYVTAENEAPYYEPLKNTLAFRFSLRAELPAIQSLRHVGRMAKKYAYFSLYRFRHAIPLIKDPIALFSAEWLAQRFDMNVVTLIRHPAAFASSLKRLNWQHNFNGFLQQPLLMQSYLAPFASEVEAFARDKQDILDQAILLWRMMHHTIRTYQQQHKDWVFLRHEDISEDPVQQFKYLFKRLNLEFTDGVRTTIEDYTNASNPGEVQNKDFFVTKRDSKANIKSWKKKLSEAEITYIRDKVEDVAHAFYADSDW